MRTIHVAHTLMLLLSFHDAEYWRGIVAIAAAQAETQAQVKPVSVAAEIPKPQRTLLVFGASWCPNCPAVHRSVTLLQRVGWKVRKYSPTARGHVFEADADEFRDLAEHYNVTQLPTILLFEDGRLVSRHGGLKAKQMSDLLNSGHLP